MSTKDNKRCACGKQAVHKVTFLQQRKKVDRLMCKECFDKAYWKDRNKPVKEWQIIDCVNVKRKGK